MNVEIGIQNVARPVSFTTDKSADEVIAALRQAHEAQDGMADLVDDKGRHILIPTSAIGYAVIGSETRRPVGFGALEG